MLKNGDPEEYVRFYLKRIERDHDMPRDFQVRYNGYEIYAGDQIVWFGRLEMWILFEEILIGRIERLEVLGLLL